MQQFSGENIVLCQLKWFVLWTKNFDRYFHKIHDVTEWKKNMKLMGKMKTKAWFQVLIFETIFTHEREISRHMRLLFDDHFLYGSDESEKKIYRAIYLPCSMYARIIWGAQCQVKSPKLPFYCFISFEMAFYLLSPCVKNFFKVALIFTSRAAAESYVSVGGGGGGGGDDVLLFCACKAF